MSADDVTTWRALMDDERESSGDTSPIVAAVAPSEDVLDIPFDAGYGSAEGKPVLVWTEDRVYYPVVYDGAEWLASVPRNPVGEGQAHSGGQ